jgi:voltage-gated potassium channel
VSTKARAGDPVRRLLTRLYSGDDPTARNFRYALLGFDILTVVYFIVTSMLVGSQVFHAIDLAIAGVLIADFFARLIVSPRPARFLTAATTFIDVIVIVALIAPVFLPNLAFLRIVRMLRLLRSYHVMRELRRIAWFRRREELLNAATDLIVFVFLTSAVVYVVEKPINPDVTNFIDALYFTVTTLTTTGFGDITMSDTFGRLLAIVMMFLGVALFFRLAQAIFHPQKVRFDCPDCGLQRHDPDAVHCKHCGRTLNIPNDGW